CCQGCFLLHLTTPSIADQECQSQHAEQLFYFIRVRHVRRLQVEATFLEVAENQFDSPAPPIERPRLLAMNAVARQKEEVVPSVFSPEWSNRNRTARGSRCPCGVSFSAGASMLEARSPACSP